MATVSNERALAEYQRRAASMINEIIMRDAAITELEQQVAALQQQLADRAEAETPFHATSSDPLHH